MRAVFLRKSTNIDELRDVKGIGAEFRIEKVVIVEQSVFNKFSNDILNDYDFISDNKDITYSDKNGVFYCLLITTREGKEGILVEHEGYDYARYTAYWKA